MAHLVLYHFESCPFCQRVRRYIAEQGYSIPMRDILEDAEAKKELLRIGGKTQVPCLVIDGKALYESRDIIAWLEEHGAS
ncbi:MAG: glutaredoxin family protein [Candidatus Margulisiibacteriota bacterium]